MAQEEAAGRTIAASGRHRCQCSQLRRALSGLGRNRGPQKGAGAANGFSGHPGASAGHVGHRRDRMNHSAFRAAQNQLGREVSVMYELQ
jgi:hypothetical protein